MFSGIFSLLFICLLPINSGNSSGSVSCMWWITMTFCTDISSFQEIRLNKSVYPATFHQVPQLGQMLHLYYTIKTNSLQPWFPFLDTDTAFHYAKHYTAELQHRPWLLRFSCVVFSRFGSNMLWISDDRGCFWTDALTIGHRACESRYHDTMRDECAC